MTTSSRCGRSPDRATFRDRRSPRITGDLRSRVRRGRRPAPSAKAKPFTTHAYGHPRRSTIQLLAMAIPEERDGATKQKVADGVADFRFMTIRKKIYATAWDGTIEVQADLQGSYSLEFSQN